MATSARLLFFTHEDHPTYRADVAVLFGKYMPRNSIYTDLVTAKKHGHNVITKWGGGETMLCEAGTGKTQRHIKSLLHSIYQLATADYSRYRAIQVRDLPILATFGLFAARIKRLPFYYWMSYPRAESQIGLADDIGLSNGLIKYLIPWVRGRIWKFLLYRILLPYADHVFVQSARMKVDMVERGVAPAKMTPVPMGVDIDATLTEELPPSDDPRLAGRRVLVYLGTQVRPRRIEVLFEMLALVKKQVPNVLLVLAGDVDDEAHRVWLRQQAQSAGVADDVLWAGWLPMREGWRYVRAAEVALSPFPRSFLLDSASPTKVPEYLALGVPVVCNDNPDQAQVIRESGGGLCVPYTPEDFANAVNQLLDLDQVRRAQMIDAGRQYVINKRDYAIIAQELAQIYTYLLE